MKKKIIGIVVIVCILFVIGIICLKALLYGGYNAQGVSKYLCIAIDESIPEKYIGEAGGYQVYSHNLSELYFVKKNAETITLKMALETKQITLQEILSVCKQQKDGSYLGENYKIILQEEKCTIMPRKLQ